MPVRAVVFDLFDTLVDLRFEDLPRVEHEGRQLPASLAKVHAAIAERADVSFQQFIDAEAVVREGIGAARFAEGRELPTAERFEAILEQLELREPELPEVLTAIHMGMLRGVVAVPHHHDAVLGALQGRVRLGLCSNFSHSDTAHRILEEAGFDARLDAVAISDAVGWRKPRKEIFESVLAELDVAPRETLHVGDSLRADVAGGRDVGVRTAWITRRVQSPEQKLKEHEGSAPDFVIRDLAELPAVLDRIEAGE